MSGCQRLFSNASVQDPPQLPTNIHDGSDAQIAALYKKLTNEGVRIETMGQMYLLSIPASVLFPEQSPRIRWRSYAVLNDIVCYLQLFRKIAVHVNSYGSCYRSKDHTYALSLARARAVGSYLWSQDIDSRMVFTEGLGDGKPIVADVKCSDSSANARIEVVFRQLLV